MQRYVLITVMFCCLLVLSCSGDEVTKPSGPYATLAVWGTFGTSTQPGVFTGLDGQDATFSIHIENIDREWTFQEQDGTSERRLEARSARIVFDSATPVLGSVTHFLNQGSFLSLSLYHHVDEFHLVGSMSRRSGDEAYSLHWSATYDGVLGPDGVPVWQDIKGSPGTILLAHEDAGDNEPVGRMPGQCTFDLDMSFFRTLRR